MKKIILLSMLIVLVLSSLVSARIITREESKGNDQLRFDQLRISPDPIVYQGENLNIHFSLENRFASTLDDVKVKVVSPTIPYAYASWGPRDLEGETTNFQLSISTRSAPKGWNDLLVFLDSDDNGGVHRTRVVSFYVA